MDFSTHKRSLLVLALLLIVVSFLEVVLLSSLYSENTTQSNKRPGLEESINASDDSIYIFSPQRGINSLNSSQNNVSSAGGEIIVSASSSNRSNSSAIIRSRSSSGNKGTRIIVPGSFSNSSILNSSENESWDFMNHSEDFGNNGSNSEEEEHNSETDASNEIGSSEGQQSNSSSSGNNAGDGSFTKTLLWNGETPVWEDSMDYFRGEITHDSSLIYKGNSAFEGRPSVYLAPGIRFEGHPLYRKAISSFERIEFYVKTASGGQTSFNLSFETYVPSQRVSRSVNIEPYIVDGGKVDNNYKLVSIPLSVFKTEDYPLDSLEILYFGTAQDGSRIYVDNIVLVAGSLTPYVPNPPANGGVQTPNTIPSSSDALNLEFLSESVIKLSSSNPITLDSNKNIQFYKISSNEDNNYANGRTPSRVGMESHLTGFVTARNSLWGDSNAPIGQFSLYLILDQPLKDGTKYGLALKNLKDKDGKSYSANSLQFTYQDNTITGSVKANQVGYLLNSPKYGYIGNYLGDAGAMQFAPKGCAIINANTNTQVYEGKISFRGEDSILSGERVYECDFSDFNSLGTYYLHVPGAGRSYNFTIGNEIYNEVYLKTARFYYYQRDGIDLTSSHAGEWARAGGHIYTDLHAKIHSISKTSSKYNSLYNNELVAPAGDFDVSRGWYDAGDYGKYVLTAAPAVFELFTAYELMPEKFSDNQLNIAESGNGVPDLLDELKWEIDWVRNMQSGDGGVFERVVTEYYASTMPADDIAQRYLSPKTTHATADYAAMLAMAARVFKSNAAFEKTYPGYTSDLLARAEKAWQFLENHPHATPAQSFTDESIVGGGSYYEVPEEGGPESDVDNRAWAAAELYKTTGKKKYEDAFKIYWKQYPSMFGYNEFNQHQKKASWAYATTKFSTDGSLVNRYKQDLKYELERPDPLGIIYNTVNNVYRQGFRADTPSYIGWGTYAKSSTYAWELIKASYLLNQPDYIKYAQINLDVQLGNNPQSQSYITGVGSQYPKDPLSTISALDGIDEPVPGLAVYGPYYSLEQGNPYKKIALSTDYWYPSGKENGPYPILRRYSDVRELVEMSEYGIGDSAPGVAAFAYFSNWKGK